ncbi:MAG: hypothetical protein KUG81_06540 [Gammaproteobacteria bacterium]|nr:hypothetical protein [Gammaproteobacteria bacterium]
MEKPIYPIEPQWKDFPTPTESNGVNEDGDKLYTKLDYIRAKKKWFIDVGKYEAAIEVYNQLKLIKIVKRSSDKLILKKYKIVKI